MDPIDTLSSEHGLIRQYLDNLTLAVEHLQAGRRPRRLFFDRAVEFARSFTDSFHHSKEEDVLFVRLAEKRPGEIDETLAALRAEHERGRELTAAVGGALVGYEAENPSSEATLKDAASALVALLRHHLWIEDHVLLPMARRDLTRTDLREIELAFLKAKAQHWDNAFERNHKLVLEMASMLAELEG